MYNHIDIRNGYFGRVHYDTEGKETYFEKKGKAVILDDIYKSIETGDITWRLSFDYLGSKEHYELERFNIAEKKMVSFLQGKGADVTAQTFNCFVNSIRLQENKFKTTKKTFDKLGWIKLHTDKDIEYGYRSEKLIGGNINAIYTGNKVLQPNGTYDAWKSMVENEVLGRVALETILLAALSAPIVGLCGINATADNPIIHINYRSGMGKSTSCELAVSVSGAPFEGMRTEYDRYGILKEYSSIYGTWGATPKATLSSHAGNRGVVVVLNELGKFVGGDMTNIVFNLSEGSDIKRMNTQLETIVSEGFNTVFISNGEMSLISRCKSKLEGIRNRVMEISVPLTQNAEHSRRIKDACRINNGFAAPMMAKYIINNGGYAMIQNLYSDTLAELTATAPSDISGRFIEKFPTFFVMAAKLAEKALGIKFDINSVVEFCYECAQKTAAENGEVDASYDDIIGECGTNIGNFFRRGENISPKPLWGVVSYPNKIDGNKLVVAEYAIKKNILKELLAKHGHLNMNTCIETWKKSGVLNYEKGRNTRSRVINSDGLTEDLYVLRILQDPPMESPNKVRKSKIIELLKEDKETEEIIENENANS